jgi:hypothetical protein
MTEDDAIAKEAPQGAKNIATRAVNLYIYCKLEQVLKFALHKIPSCVKASAEDSASIHANMTRI